MLCVKNMDVTPCSLDIVMKGNAIATSWISDVRFQQSKDFVNANLCVILPEERTLFNLDVIEALYKQY